MKIQNEEAVSPGKAVTTEDAVSPVIGVILMVAITVILAAVIAAFVFGLAGTTGSTKSVGLTVTQNATDIGVITLQGGSDLPSLTALEYSTDGNTYNDLTYANDTDASAPFTTGQILYTSTDTIDGNRLIIRGSFEDGSQQVLFDKQF